MINGQTDIGEIQKQPANKPIAKASLFQSSRLSYEKQNKLIELFVAGSTARTAASLVEVNKSTAAYYFHRLRELIYHNLESRNSSDFEINTAFIKQFLGKKNILNKLDKYLVFAILKHDHILQTKIFSLYDENLNEETALLPSSIVIFNSAEKNKILDVNILKQFRIEDSELDSQSPRKFNEIENFWNQSKRHLRKYNGIPKNKFHLFIKECEWRYNNNCPKDQLNQLKHWANSEPAK